MIELEIGETADIDGIRVTCVEQKRTEIDCLDCAFSDGDARCIRMECCCGTRRDRKWVKFIKTEKQ